MPRIDKFVQALFQFKADRLEFVTGEKVALVTGDEVRTVSAQPAVPALLEGVLQEIVPQDMAPRIGSTGNHEFPYLAPAGPVTIRVRRDSGSLSFSVVAYGQRPQRRKAPEPEPQPEPQPAADAADPAEGAWGEDARPSPEPAEAPAGDTPAPPASPVDGVSFLPYDPGARPHAAREGAPAIESYFQIMIELGCSDLHLCSGNPPLFRKDGDIVPLAKAPPLSPEEVRELLMEITPEVNREQFEAEHDTDFAYEIPGEARFRCNLFLDRKGPGGVFRLIPTKILTAEDLGLPEAVLELCFLEKGLVVVTGPTGSGKSTSLAAMVDHLNAHRPGHLITIEDPVEFVHDNKRCLVNQREIGPHTRGFKSALRAALREDPDIILVGEMRDLETVAIAIETAETGHLVFGTLHTNTAPSTVDRIIDQFPSDRQAQIRTMLSESLKAVVAQTLCKKKGGGRVAAYEILLVTHSTANLIREGKTFQIPSIMQTGRGLGMRTLNQSLLELVEKELVEPAEALAKAVDKGELRKGLARLGVDVDVL